MPKRCENHTPLNQAEFSQVCHNLTNLVYNISLQFRAIHSELETLTRILTHNYGTNKNEL